MTISSEVIPENRYEFDQMPDVFRTFIKSYPSFNQTRLLDDWRETEYGRLDAKGQIYLDYSGGGMYGDSQLHEHMELLRRNVLGNPHSANPTSLAMTDLVEETRDYVLRYFNASAEEYIAIFTSNASGALKLVGESFPFTPASHCILTFDNHNSVNGIREFAKVKGAHVTYVPLTKPDLRIEQAKLEDILNQVDGNQNNLFAFPAQSNFYGPDERLLDYRRIEELANEKGISQRTGCFCNPGAGEIAEGLTAEDMVAGLNQGPNLSLPHFLQVIQHRGNKSAGAIRISIGLTTNFTDGYRFMHFAAGFRDQTNMNIGEVTFDIRSCRVIRDGS